MEGDPPIDASHMQSINYDVRDGMKAVEDGVHALIDSLPGLLGALEEIAKLHPFTAGA